MFHILAHHTAHFLAVLDVPSSAFTFVLVFMALNLLSVSPFGGSYGTSLQIRLGLHCLAPFSLFRYLLQNRARD